MGWRELPSCRSRSEVIDYLLNEVSDEFEVIQHVEIGSNLWMLFKIKSTHKFVICLYKIHGQGTRWGYKSISEDCSPAALDVPLSFLEYPHEAHPIADAWRDRVIAYHSLLDHPAI